jgi:hypothetical protein
MEPHPSFAAQADKKRGVRFHPASVVSGTEYGAADAHHSRALAHGVLKIAAHAHGQLRNRNIIVFSPLNVNKKLSHTGKIARFFRPDSC